MHLQYLQIKPTRSNYLFCLQRVYSNYLIRLVLITGETASDIVQ